MKEPELRIRGFKGEWRQSSLNNCLQINVSKNKGNIYRKDQVLSVSDDYGIVNQVKHLGRSYAGASVENYKILRKGQIVYTKSPLKEKPYGIIKVNDGETGIVSVLYAVYDAKEYIFPDFIGRYFEPSSRINFYLLPLINKGAKNTINISDENSLKGCIFLPEVKEQQAIADFFQSLDSMITLTSKKIDKLKQTLTGCMQTMFPEEGELEPKIRFKEFKGKWGENKALNIFSPINEKNRPDLPVLSANQNVRGMAPRSETGYQISHDKRNEVGYKHVLPGQFVMHLRSFQGGFAHASLEGITSPAYTVFGLKDTSAHYDMYWKYVFMSEEFVHRLITITYGIRDGRSISFDEFTKMNFIFPSYDEQKKIADYITTFYEVVALQTKRLDLLKHIKSACLDNMFI